MPPSQPNRRALSTWLLTHLGGLGSLVGASAPRPAQATPTAPDTLPTVSDQRVLRFPQDHGAHPEARTEWWYITGQLQPQGGPGPLGFQITFFRTRVDAAQNNPSQFAARQLVMAHVALSDVPKGQLQHDQRLARTGFGLADAAQGDTRVHLRDWTLTRHPEGPNSRYEARLRARHFELDLQLRSTQPVMLQGEQGHSRKGPAPGDASHYYSQPHLQVSGKLRRSEAASPLPVVGRAWLDHEWSDAYLPAQAVGWDWIGMNLDDGRALMAFRMRRADGTTLWAGGSLRGPGQATQRFAPHALRFIPLRHWTSPATQARYPVHWSVQTPVGRFEVRALFDAQELDGKASTGAVYWEGLSELLDADLRPIGRGYLEMTGYVKPLSLS
jgi:predicted secreted hydrolase